MAGQGNATAAQHQPQRSAHRQASAPLPQTPHPPLPGQRTLPTPAMVAVIISATAAGRKSGSWVPARSPYSSTLLAMPPMVAGSRISTAGTTSARARQGGRGSRASDGAAGRRDAPAVPAVQMLPAPSIHCTPECVQLAHAATAGGQAGRQEPSQEGRWRTRSQQQHGLGGGQVGDDRLKGLHLQRRDRQAMQALEAAAD